MRQENKIEEKYY